MVPIVVQVKLPVYLRGRCKKWWSKKAKKWIGRTTSKRITGELKLRKVAMWMMKMWVKVVTFTILN